MKKLEVEQRDDIIEAHRFLDGQEFEHFLIINTEEEQVICDDCDSEMRLYEHQGLDGDSMEYYICDKCEMMVDIKSQHSCPECEAIKIGQSMWLECPTCGKE